MLRKIQEKKLAFLAKNASISLTNMKTKFFRRKIELLWSFVNNMYLIKKFHFWGKKLKFVKIEIFHEVYLMKNCIKIKDVKKT